MRFELALDEELSLIVNNGRASIKLPRPWLCKPFDEVFGVSRLCFAVRALELQRTLKSTNGFISSTLRR